MRMQPPNPCDDIAVLAERFRFVRQALFETTLQFLVRLVCRRHGTGLGHEDRLGLRGTYAELTRSLRETLPGIPKFINIYKYS